MLRVETYTTRYTMPNLDDLKKLVAEANKRTQDLARAIDQVASHYWPGRSSPFGQEETHGALVKVGAPPRGIVTAKQAMRLLEIEYAQYLAAIIESERERLAKVKAMLARRGAAGLLGIVAWISGGKIPLAKEVKKSFELVFSTRSWRDLELDFRARCATARKTLLERQAGRFKNQEVRPETKKTHVRKIYSRRPPSSAVPELAAEVQSISRKMRELLP